MNAARLIDLGDHLVGEIQVSPTTDEGYRLADEVVGALEALSLIHI